jgi:DNA-binding CsgD family transcriptional regulator
MDMGRYCSLELEPFIDRIYEAAILPDLWPRALADMTKVADAAFASLFALDGTVVRWTGTPEAIALIDNYKTVEKTHPNSRIAPCMRSGHAGFLVDHDLLTREEIDADPFYREFLRPRGYGWVAATHIETPMGENLFISAERRFERGPVEPRYIRLLNCLRPHYARSAMLAARIGLERANAMTKILELFRLPAAVLLRNGVLFAANKSFDALVPKVFLDRRKGIAIRDEKTDALLGKLLAMGTAGQRPVQSIPLTAVGDRPPLIIHVIPVCGDARDIFSHGMWIIVVTPVVPRDVPAASVLQGLFDLTPGEARVAKCVGQAQSLDEIAFSLGLSRETVRSRVKAILSKTGLHRQAELANLLAGLPRDK